MNNAIHPSALYTLFGLLSFLSYRVQLDLKTEKPTATRWRGRSVSNVVELDDACLLEQRSGMFFHTLLLKDASGQVVLTLKGLSEATTRSAFQQMDAFIREKASNQLNRHRHEFQWIANLLERISGRRIYLSERRWSKLHEYHQIISFYQKLKYSNDHLDPSVRRGLDELARFTNDHWLPPDSFRADYNREFVHTELARFSSFFDRVESNPLTERQRDACVIDETANLVLAGAGTGKTSTLIGKAGYLVKSGLAKPDEILLLAYGRKASIEMQERIVERLGSTEITASTFHSFGLSLLAEVEGKKPSLSKMAENDQDGIKAIDQIVNHLADRHPVFLRRINNYFSYLFAARQTEFDFDSLKEYHDYISNAELITLTGERVKSFGELMVANTLTRLGIAYEYEKTYEKDTATMQFRQYKPDFYLPKQGIYIEYFGINRKGETAPYIDKDSYQQQMAWKRGLHKRHGTQLIEFYSYELSERTLPSRINIKLTELNVPLNSISDKECLEILRESERVFRLSNLMANFIGLFKQANADLETLRAKAKSGNFRDGERLLAFLELFEMVFQRYEEKLREDGEIDFNDMINKATAYLKSGTYHPPYRYILVDEFQDISHSRSQLVQALMESNSDAQLFAVGDDWQAIYRFSGADVGLTRDFESYFGTTERIALDRTFRFNNKISEAASRFVTENPSQIKKMMITHKQVSEPAIRLINTGPVVGESLDQLCSMENYIIRCLGAISRKKANASVYIIGRNNKSKLKAMEGVNLKSVQNQFPDMKIDYITAHDSKGKEADFTILVGLQERVFPNEKQNDEILELVLPPREPFAFAEERRLFYVALTRARDYVFILVDLQNRSAFIDEMLMNNYEVTLRCTNEETLEPIPCHACESGHLVMRASKKRLFYGCSNFPHCNHSANMCPTCDTAPVVQASIDIKKCRSSQCGYVERICPSCRVGTLVKRKGPYGEFYGCTQYGNEADSCRYHENIAKFVQRLTALEPDSVEAVQRWS